ncbi:MAG: hypothetical protein JSU70_16470 [Phycisphaerales bacterium]|nr:MAG: hypothetical protein JSU70_16470 [Phycisphaerales bacterium]
MKKTAFIEGLLGVVFSVTAAVSAEDRIGFEVTADYFSKYVWRGQNPVADSVFQPSVSAAYKGLTGSIWGNCELTTVNGNSGEFTEVDYSIDYSRQFPRIEWLGYSVGLIYYDFPNTGFASTTELYWGFSADVLLSPSVTAYLDVDQVQGTYLSFAVGHSVDRMVELGPDVPVGLELGAAIGWGSSSYNASYWSVPRGELNDLALSVSVPISIAGCTVTPSVHYVTLLGDGIRASGAGTDFFFAGIGITKAL